MPLLTENVDITPDREPDNLDRLSDALADLEARLRSSDDPNGVAFPIGAAMLGAAMLGAADSWTLITRAGDLDLLFSPAATPIWPLEARP